MQIALIPDDGRKAEICSKITVYGISIKIIVLTEPNKKHSLTTQYDATIQHS
jgi:hypothetical protein